mmetsp:Transcript_4125/g.7527  ORF Transcript_4125/g.7527 Transcript_4125/m.7527 type:complete len:282 (+) Transcript_4125:78-923(+)
MHPMLLRYLLFIGDTNDNLPQLLTALGARVSRGHVLQTKDHVINQGRQLSCVHHAGGLLHDRALALALRDQPVQHGDEHEDDVQREALEVHGREVRLVLRDDGHDLPVDPGRLHARAEVGAARRVEHDVEPAPVREPLHVALGRLLAVVDRVRAVVLHDARLLAGRHRREHPAAFGGRQLHRHVADPARAAVHQHLVAGLDERALEESLPRGDGHQGQRRGLVERELARGPGEKAGVGRDVLGEGSAHPPHAARAAEDPVADGELLDSGADRHDRAGDVAA